MKREQVVRQMREQGMSIAKIVKATGLKRVTVEKLLVKFWHKDWRKSQR